MGYGKDAVRAAKDFEKILHPEKKAAIEEIEYRLKKIKNSWGMYMGDSLGFDVDAMALKSSMYDRDHGIEITDPAKMTTGELIYKLPKKLRDKYTRKLDEAVESSTESRIKEMIDSFEKHNGKYEGEVEVMGNVQTFRTYLPFAINQIETFAKHLTGKRAKKVPGYIRKCEQIYKKLGGEEKIAERESEEEQKKTIEYKVQEAMEDVRRELEADLEEKIKPRTLERIARRAAKKESGGYEQEMKKVAEEVVEKRTKEIEQGYKDEMKNAIKKIEKGYKAKIKKAMDVLKNI